ncbi:MAG: ACT domain-containing protein, partial [Pontibacterium sp.]
QDHQPLPENPEYLADITTRLVEGLDDPEDYPEIIHRHVPRQLKLFTTPTAVTISTDPTRGETILEVVSPDRPGLLARIGRILVENNVSICKARITSIGERVEDFFYLTDAQNNPISDPDVCEKLQRDICKELDQHQQ